VRDDTSGTVIGAALNSVVTIDSRIAATPEEKEALDAWVRKNFKPALDRLGPPSASDTPETKELRATLFGSLGTIGKDPEVIAQAKDLAAKYLADQSSVDSNLAQAATLIAAINGDAAFFDQLQKVAETSTNPEIQEGALRMLAGFKDPALAKRSLDYAVSGKVRNQDSVIELLIALQSADTRDLAWQYIQQNWSKVQAQVTTSMGGYLVGGTGIFCSAEKRDEVMSFFATHNVPASERALARARDQINDCIELRSLQEPKLREWIASQK
jgi:aminopeptidase N/puromycin-sensitive aminopeptidase